VLLFRSLDKPPLGADALSGRFGLFGLDDFLGVLALGLLPPFFGARFFFEGEVGIRTVGSGGFLVLLPNDDDADEPWGRASCFVEVATEGDPSEAAEIFI